MGNSVFRIWFCFGFSFLQCIIRVVEDGRVFYEGDVFSIFNQVFVIQRLWWVWVGGFSFLCRFQVYSSGLFVGFIRVFEGVVVVVVFFLVVVYVFVAVAFVFYVERVQRGRVVFGVVYRYVVGVEELVYRCGGRGRVVLRRRRQKGWLGRRWLGRFFIDLFVLFGSWFRGIYLFIVYLVQGRTFFF